MILDNHYAVVFRPASRNDSVGRLEKHLMTENAWKCLEKMAKEGHFVILEAWDITKGKCVSN